MSVTNRLAAEMHQDCRHISTFNILNVKWLESLTVLGIKYFFFFIYSTQEALTKIRTNFQIVQNNIVSLIQINLCDI